MSKVVLSLFDGMSVAQQALKELNVDVKQYYASEIDPYAIAVTQSNFPETKQLGNVTCVRGGWNVPRVGDVALLIGGSPCQDLSIAKKSREGLAGSRSGLFWEYVRILKEVEPVFFILENVNSMPKEAKDTISEALGVQPVMINASLVSAQNRKRLFWIGKWNAEKDKYEQVEVPQPVDQHIYLKDILEDGVNEIFQTPRGKNNGGVKVGKAPTLSASSYQDNNKPIRLGSLNSGGQADRIYSRDGKSITLSANGGGGGAKTGLYVVPVALRNRGNGKKPEYNGTNKANAMTSVQTDSMVEVDTQIRKLTPIECLRLQSMPDDYFDKATYKGKPISNSQRYKMCGNAFNKNVIVHILKCIFKP